MTGRKSHQAAVICYCRNMQASVPLVLANIRQASEKSKFDVFVIDDCSIDGSKEMITSFCSAHQDISLLAFSHFLGISQSLNKVFEKINNELVIVIVADSMPVGLNWAEDLARIMSDKDLALAGATKVSVDGRILSAGRQIITGLGWDSLYTDCQRLDPDLADSDLLTERDSLASGLVCVRRQAWLDGIKFDPVFASCLSDAWLDDYSMSIRQKNCGKIMVAGNVRTVGLVPYAAPIGTDLPGFEVVSKCHDRLKFINVGIWQKKWQWNPQYPDLNLIRSLYGKTDICWQIGDSMRIPDRLLNGKPHVDLCMVTCKGAGYLEKCLRSLAATDYPADKMTLRILDNGGSGEVLNILDRLDLPFETVRQELPVNVGLVGAMNWLMDASLKAGKADLVAKLDDDIVVEPDWLTKLLAIFAVRPFAGVVGPKIVDLETCEGKDRLQFAACSFYPDIHAYEQEPDLGQVGGLCRVAHLRGCCCLYRADALRRLGLMDIRFSPSQWDDVDHHLTMYFAGYELVYDGSVTVRHRCATGRVASPCNATISSANKTKIEAKWGNTARLDLGILLSEEGRWVSRDAGKAVWGTGNVGPLSLEEEIVIKSIQLQKDLADKLVEELDKGLSFAELAAQANSEALRYARLGQGRKALRQSRIAAIYEPFRLEYVRNLAAIMVSLGAGLPSGLVALTAPSISSSQSAPTVQGVLANGRTGFRWLATTGSAGKNILFVIPASCPESVEQLLLKFATMLENAGFSVALTDHPCPDPENFALIHFWTLCSPAESLAQIKAVRNLAPERPRLLSPLLNTPGAAVAQPDDKFFQDMVLPLADKLLFTIWQEASNPVAFRILLATYFEQTGKK